MKNEIIIKATDKEATMMITYRGETYNIKCVATDTGAKYEGDLEKIRNADVPEELIDLVNSFMLYDLIEAVTHE